MSRRLQALSTSGEAPAPFVAKTFDLVSDVHSNDVVSWTNDGQSFVVYKQDMFSSNLLPQYFKHNNFSSFVRQLNTYGFRKVDADRWEFSQDLFRQNRPDLLNQIQRRRAGGGQPTHTTPSAQAAIEVGQFGGLADDVEALKRDKNVLMGELVRVRQQQQEATHQMNMMQSRLESSEQRQNQMIQFLSKALQHPELIHQLAGARQRISHNGKRGSGRKKLKRRVARDDTSFESSGDHPSESQPNFGNQLVAYQGHGGSSGTALAANSTREEDNTCGFSELDESDEADSADRQPDRRPHASRVPPEVARIGAELHNISLAHKSLPNGGSPWAPSVQIAEHDPMAQVLMSKAAQDSQMSLKQAPNPADSSSTGMNEEYTSNAMNANPQFPSQHVKQEVHRGDAQQALQGVRSMSLDEQLRQLPSLGQLPDDVLLSNLDTLSTVDGSNELGTFSDIFSNPDPLLLQKSTFVASSAGTIPSGAEQPFPCRADTSSPTDAETVRQEQLRDYPMASSPAVGIRSGFDNNGLTSFPARDVHQDDVSRLQQQMPRQQQQQQQPRVTYGVDDFNRDLLHSGDAIDDAVSMPPAGGVSDDLWQQFLVPTSPEAST